MQNANDHYSVLDHAIEDHVPTIWQATQLWAKVLTGAAHERMRCQHATTLFNRRHEASGIGRVIASNKVADFDEIALGMLGEPQLRDSSTSREPLLQSREYIVSVVHPAGRQVVEPCLQVSL